MRTLGPEAAKFDDALASNSSFPLEVRDPIWTSAQRILTHGPVADFAVDSATGIAIGYVQSGKTTSFTSLIACAADSGYRVIVALLGSTNLLLDQNTDRLVDALQLRNRVDYRWIHLHNPGPDDIRPSELGRYLEKGRIVLITLLKHHIRIGDAARVLTAPPVKSLPALVIDDEADQTSLNTLVKRGDESRTYQAIGDMRRSLGPHAYVQYTATPYAPLLLEVDDFLAPQFVELLTPGPGYVGGKEFFVDNRATTIRELFDAPETEDPPLQLPPSLVRALADFVAGSAILLDELPSSAPISMLVHPSGRTAVHARYDFLLRQQVESWRMEVLSGTWPIPLSRAIAEINAFRDEREPASLGDAAKYVLEEVTPWLVNSTEQAVRTVRWNLSPVHILVGGNKLDRGFTVEGLTVSWIGRRSSPQLDTSVQRARAFGYRAPYLPFCRIYADRETIDALSSSVETDLDMRAQLRDWLDQGLPVSDWATEAGLIMLPGLKPSRDQVFRSINSMESGWRLMSRPPLASDRVRRNLAAVEAIDLRNSARVAFGRIAHPVKYLTPQQALETFIESWDDDESPGWRRNSVRAWLRRARGSVDRIAVIWIAAEDGSPRVRAWDDRLGFEQLMQGRDVNPRHDAYPGDRALMPEQPQIQVHLVTPRADPSSPTVALAAFLPVVGRIVTRGARGA